MNANHDVTRIVRSWIREEETDSADRVLQVVLSRLDTTPQRRSWWPARRTPNMNPAYKVAFAAVAVLVAVVVGYNVLPKVPGPGNPTLQPTTQPTVAPTPSPAATVPPMPPEGRALSPGQYAIQVPDSDIRAVVTVEGGWTSGLYFIMNPPALTKQVSFWTVANVYDDICDPATGGLPTASQLPRPAVGSSVNELVAALDDQANSDMSALTDVTVGGYAGKRVTMALSESSEDCIGLGGDESRPMWVDATGQPQRRLQPGFVDTLWIVDVDGQRVVIVTHQAFEGPGEDADSIAGVIGSVEFEVP